MTRRNGKIRAQMLTPIFPSGATSCALTFTGSATDVTYTVQATGTLAGPWTTLATFSGANALGTFTVQDSQAVGASSKRFMRLQVTGP